MTPDRICAAFDPYDKGGAYLRVDDAGFELFREWRAGLEHRLRSGELHPAVESHLAKYRKLVPSLALIHHLAGFGSGAVGERSVLAALAWAQYQIGRATCRASVCQYV